MPDCKAFFNTPEEIVLAIRHAEEQTSGEIRVHIENHCTWDALDRAKEVFEELKMHNTRLRNGVLIYIATKDHKMAILGDEAMDKLVGDNFWNEEIHQLRSFFSQRKFDEGVIKTIEDIGTKLKRFFPADADFTDNELTNEISIG